MEQIQHEDFYDQSQKKQKDYGTPTYYKRKWATLRKYSQERFYFYDLALKIFAVAQIKGLRLIMENPWHPTNFTNHFWFARTSLIDNDRTRRGDYFRKPTAYWFINCTPTMGETLSPTPKNQIKVITAGSGALKTKRKLKSSVERSTLDKTYIDHTSATNLCDEERSMISPTYARNFILDFILGKPTTGSQLFLFND